MAAVITIILIVGLIFFSFLFLKTEHQFRRLKIVLIILLVFFLYFSIMGVFSSKKVDLSSPKGVVNAVYVYFGWIGHTISNLWNVGVETTHAVGNAIKINKSEERNGS